MPAPSNKTALDGFSAAHVRGFFEHRAEWEKKIREEAEKEEAEKKEEEEESKQKPEGEKT